MKYLKIFENAPAIGNDTVQFTSKNDKLNEIRDEINGILSTTSDKKIGYNYATGSKGIFFTTSTGELVDGNGYGCTTYSELLSNLEAILYSVKHIHSQNMGATQEPIEILPAEAPTNEIIPEPQTPTSSEEPQEIPVPEEKVESFENFKSKL